MLAGGRDGRHRGSDEGRILIEAIAEEVHVGDAQTGGDLEVADDLIVGLPVDRKLLVDCKERRLEVGQPTGTKQRAREGETIGSLPLN